MGSDPKFTAPVVCVDAFNPVLATGWRQEIRGQLKFTAPVVCVDAFNSAHAGLCQAGPCQLPCRKYSPSAPCPVELQRPSGAVILGSDPNCAATRSQHTAAPKAIGLRPQYHGPAPSSSKAIAASAYSTGATSQFLSDNCPERRPH